MSEANTQKVLISKIENCSTTLLGSVPHNSGRGLCETLATTLDVPAWPQLTRRSFHENMYVQFSASLPCITLDPANEKIGIDTSSDLAPDLEKFYERYISEDITSFGLSREYAEGFFLMLDALKDASGNWAKGQVTGPISFGLTVTDQDLRASLYDDTYADVIIKNVAMNARWQIQQLRTIRPNIVLFVDEPYMAAFGSAFISLSRERVIDMLNEVFAAIHQEGALAGVHCCANTDWSVLMATSADILNMDAHGYLDNLALYPGELRDFLDRGGVIAWGIVPNTDEIRRVTPEQIVQRLVAGINRICEKAKARDVMILQDELFRHSLISPSCGLGPTTVDIADQVIETLVATSELLKAAQ